MSQSKGNYTNPALHERIKQRVMRGDKGGKPGQWSARKAQMVAAQYKAAGGHYRGAKTSKQKSLSKWTKQKWTTSSGKPSLKGGGVYAPKRTIAALKGTKSGRNKLARANRVKNQSTKQGKQYAPVGIHKGKHRNLYDEISLRI